MTDISVPKYSKKYYAKDSKIRTHPANDEYRDGWDRIFGKKQKAEDTIKAIPHAWTVSNEWPCDPPRCGTCGYMHSWPSKDDGSCSPSPARGIEMRANKNR